MIQSQLIHRYKQHPSPISLLFLSAFTATALNLETVIFFFASLIYSCCGSIVTFPAVVKDPPWLVAKMIDSLRQAWIQDSVF